MTNGPPAPSQDIASSLFTRWPDRRCRETLTALRGHPADCAITVPAAERTAAAAPWTMQSVVG